MQRLSFLSLSDEEAKDVLATYRIGLTVAEARDVETMLGRPLTLTEAVIWGIQGSEHCSYKSSRRFLSLLPTDGSRVILGPKEDAGIIAITDGPKGKRWGLVIGHESHNHPSQIVPYEGAATGIGGCVRDVLCMGARVLGCMDALRLGDLRKEETRAIAKEVVRGIAGYGNPLGIPNLGGDTYFDASYNGNCLVNAVTIGLVREDEVIHSFVPDEAGEVGYDIILIGKATDRSGFGGAAFASAVMEEDKREQNTGAVQEPNPFLERHLLASTYDLFDYLARENLLSKVSFKDLGAGGVVCSAVEQVDAKGMGADIDLEAVHTALDGLPPEVIACAETQERFCWICHPDLTETILAHYNERWDLPSVAENARASVIGKVRNDPAFRLRYKGEIVCDAPSQQITSGLRYNRPTVAATRSFDEPAIQREGDSVTVAGARFTFADIFRAMLAHPSYGGKEAIYRHYDKNVMGNTVLEPGEADAGVVMPLQDPGSYVHAGVHPGWDIPEEDRHVGVALAIAGNGRYGRISPYLQGANAVTETMLRVAATGAVPRALTDCLNYGNPEVPEQLWELEEGVRGIADAARGIAIDGEPVPIISGNVSLYNVTPQGGSIDPTAIVACVGVMEDARKAVGMRLQRSDSLLYLLGEPKDECGGSAYHAVLEALTGAERNACLDMRVPSPDFDAMHRAILFLSAAVSREMLLAAHHSAEGGLLLALYEMTEPRRKIGGSIGMDIDLSAVSEGLENDTVLFSETPCVLLEVAPETEIALQSLAEEMRCPLRRIGTTTPESSLRVTRNGNLLFSESTVALREIAGSAVKRAWNPQSGS